MVWISTVLSMEAAEAASATGLPALQLEERVAEALGRGAQAGHQTERLGKLTREVEGVLAGTPLMAVWEERAEAAYLLFVTLLLTWVKLLLGLSVLWELGKLLEL